MLTLLADIADAAPLIAYVTLAIWALGSVAALVLWWRR